MDSVPQQLFSSAVDYYAQYRPGYPQSLVDALAARAGLDGTQRVLDVGCGTGQLTIPRARHARAVVAIDPVAGMLARGQQAAQAAGAGNVTWLEGDSSQIAALAGPGADLAVFAASFHWTGRPSWPSWTRYRHPVVSWLSSTTFSVTASSRTGCTRSPGSGPGPRRPAPRRDRHRQSPRRPGQLGVLRGGHADLVMVTATDRGRSDGPATVVLVRHPGPPGRQRPRVQQGRPRGRPGPVPGGRGHRAIPGRSAHRGPALSRDAEPNSDAP